MIEYELIKIDKAVKETDGTWKAFEEKHSVNKRRIKSYIEKLNRWLRPIGLEIKVVEIKED